MRLIITGVAFVLCITTALAQQPSRWTLSAGPEWAPLNYAHSFGGRLRAEYDLITPTSPFRLRLEAGTFWSPTQGYAADYIDGSSVVGTNQTADLTFGISAAFTPLPRARISPYLTVAALARQDWSRGSAVLRNPDGSLASTYSPQSRTRGDVLVAPGIGIRARIAGHMFQLEMRRLQAVGRRSVTFGTTLPF